MEAPKTHDPADVGVAGGPVQVVCIVLIPILVGITLGMQWPDAGESFYSSVSQVVATLFIAIAVEFFAREASRKSPLDRLRLVLLVGQSWIGFFACIRALAGDPSGVMVGLAGAGVTAASILVSLTLYEQIEANRDESEGRSVMGQVIVLLFLVATLVFLLPV